MGIYSLHRQSIYHHPGPNSSPAVFVLDARNSVALQCKLCLLLTCGPSRVLMCNHFSSETSGETLIPIQSTVGYIAIHTKV